MVRASVQVMIDIKWKCELTNQEDKKGGVSTKSFSTKLKQNYTHHMELLDHWDQSTELHGEC
jgi:hypothetical protein